MDEGFKLSRSCCVPADKLYPITVLEQAGKKVKIHNEGYGEEFDEFVPQLLDLNLGVYLLF